jgi:DNA-binding response OmpR family regulator
MNDIKIALIEDDVDLLEVLRVLLTEKQHIVFCYEKAEDFLKEFKDINPDVIISDRNLPGADGFELVKKVRAENSSIPIFVISGYVDVEAQLEAYNIGVDDFVKKPFNYEILEAKFIRALQRSKEKVRKRPEYTFEEHKQMIKMGDQELTFTPGEFIILKRMMEGDSNLITKKLKEFHSIKTSFDVHMHSLRKKVKKIGWEIKNVRGKGYYLEMS